MRLALNFTDIQNRNREEDQRTFFDRIMSLSASFLMWTEREPFIFPLF